MKCVLVLVLLTGLFPGLCFCVHAQDDQYVQIYSLIQEGDSLNNSSRPALALAKYIEAQTTLQKFQRVYPDWNSKVVGFRLDYLASKIADLSAKLPPPAPPAATASPPAPGTAAAAPASPSDKTELENQLRALQNQVQQLQANNLVLEAKLKEAFSAQPASVDPRELTKARDQIRSIEKENALLKVSLGQQQARVPVEPDTNLVEQLRQELAVANRKLAEQTGKTAAAAITAAALQKKLDAPAAAAAPSVPGVQATQKALDDANHKLAEQNEVATKLTQEKENLQLRIRTLESNTEAMNALHAENEILKKQLADLKPNGYAGTSGQTNRQLAAAQAQIAALQSDKEILHLQTIALQERVKQLMVPGATSTPVPAAAFATTDSAHVKQLEHEKADLQKKLEAAQKQLYGRKGKSAAARIEDLTGQLEILRARLGVYETQAVPYSPEELALFKSSETVLAGANPKAGQKSVRELPAGAATLVAAAQHDFSAKQFDQAEQKYLQIVQQDEKNTYTLANLASIQLQLNHLDDAEKHIRQALTQAPDDAYSLLVLGEIDIRRDKYDDALDALSRAAKLDSQNPEIQNYLGLTLSQKGLRTAAEAAFRKAVQLDPGYAGAHHNLAVFYVTQKPPWTELARWHYKKAIAEGFPHNPDLEKMLDMNKPVQ